MQLLQWPKAKKQATKPVRQGDEVKRVERVARAPLSLKTAYEVAYELRWASDNRTTWEPVEHISPEVLRQFESSWWASARAENGAEPLHTAITRGSAVLPLVRDRQQRTALHYACGRGDTSDVHLLLRNGAVVDAADVQGFTPLHMAAGYAQPDALDLLLQFGCDPDVKDGFERTACDVAQTLLARVQASNERDPQVSTLQRVIATLENAMELEERLVRVHDARPKQASPRNGSADGGAEQASSSSGSYEYLVEFLDEDEPNEQWVDEADVPDRAIDDFQNGVETAVATSVLSRRYKDDGASEELLVQWADGTEPSWEPAAHVPTELLPSSAHGALPSSA